MKFILLGAFALTLIVTTFGNKCQEEPPDPSTKGEGTYAEDGKSQF